MSEKFSSSSYEPKKDDAPKMNWDLKGGFNLNEKEGLNTGDMFGDASMSISDKLRIKYRPGSAPSGAVSKTLAKESANIMSVREQVEKDKAVSAQTVSYEEGQAKLRAQENESKAGDEILMASLEEKLKSL